MLAYLISAYRDPEHLARLVRGLDEDADFFVHVDANVDDAPFRAALGEKVTFVRRWRVSWGGWNQVEYQRELLRAALSTGKSYDHLVCLSGQDYPLWSNRRIHQFFGEHAEREFISGYNLTAGDSKEGQRKFTHLHPFRDLPWQNQWWKNKAIVLSRHLLALLGIRREAYVEISGAKCPIYFGSDYWAITPACARYVLETLDEQPEIIRYFRSTFVPSELCLQTLIFNSPFAEQAILHTGHYSGLTVLTPLHFIDYGKCVRVLTVSDLPRLKESGKLFCRKCATGVSDSLRMAVDKERN